MRICTLSIFKIRFREKVKNEPVISLTQYFNRNTTGLLGNQHGAEVVFTTFFYPLNIWRRRCGPFVKYGLGLFNYNYCGYGLRNSFCKLRLIPIKDSSQHEPCEYHRRTSAQL